MPLPEPFSDVEHLQSVVRRYLNKQIREDFRDLFGDSETWEPEVGTTRGSMLRALLHEDSDPMLVTATRMMLYYFTYGKAAALQPPQYSIPIKDFQETQKFRPQIHLMFFQSQLEIDVSSDPNNFYKQPVQGQISFRLTTETTNTLTNADLERYGNRIKTNFGAAGGFKWLKGKTTVAYTDRAKGYRLKLYCRSEAEGRRIIEQVLDIQQDTPDWSKMTVIENAEPLERYPITPVPRTQMILGKSTPKPIERPNADVRYRYSLIHIHGLPNPRILHSLSSTHRKAIVK